MIVLFYLYDLRCFMDLLLIQFNFPIYLFKIIVEKCICSFNLNHYKYDIQKH